MPMMRRSIKWTGGSLPLVAHYGPIMVPDSLPLTPGVLAGRAVLDRQTIQVADLQAETDEYPEGSEIARRLGLRTNLAVPLIRVRDAIDEPQGPKERALADAKWQAFMLYAICVSTKKSASDLTIEFIATCSECTRSPRCLTYSYAACSRSKSG